MERGVRALIVLAWLSGCGGAVAPAVRPALGPPGLELADHVALGMVDGPPTAAVTVVEAFDLMCAHCRQLQPALDELVREYAGKLQVVYALFVIHPESSTEANLGVCAAAAQGKFRAFTDAAMAELDREAPSAEELLQRLAAGAPVGELDVTGVARRVGLDLPAFDAERAAPRCRALLERDRAALDKLGLDHVPTFYVDGKVVDARTKQELRAAIDARLAAPR